MSKTTELIDLIKSDDQTRRFQELEKIIDHNKSITDEYQKLLALQKIMVKYEFEKSTKVTEAKKNYDIQLQKVREYPIIEEYLELLDDLNNDILLIKSIIEDEIAIDFD